MVTTEDEVSLNPMPAGEPRKRFWKINHAAKLLAADGISQFLSPTGDWLPLIRFLPKSETKRIGLSFDDGPTPDTTEVIIGLLARYNGKATFFLSGERISQNPQLVELLVKSGHDVFGHGWSHLRYKTPDQLISNIDRVEKLLQQSRP